MMTDDQLAERLLSMAEREEQIVKWMRLSRADLDVIREAAARLKAKAIEARRAETVKQGSVEDESAVANGDLPKPSGSDPQEKVG